tara:strand:- start:3292 stop:4143 length:852 start_codon:yes stop_codon:yes gene_type:complete
MLSPAKNLFALDRFDKINSAPELTFQVLAQKCREKFPDVAVNPSAAGGIAVVHANYANAACIFGSLENVDLVILDRLKTDPSVNVLVLRSTGGPVSIWLRMAEVLWENTSVVFVDEACFSSCANYAFVLGKQRVVNKGGLVVWHGGPVDNGDNQIIFSNSVHSKAEMQHEEDEKYKELALRTDELYRNIDINPALLSITARSEISPEAIDAASRILGKEVSSLNFVGYALPPAVLTRCFRLTGLDSMWHPGSERETVAAGLKRSKSLLIASEPSSLRKGCPAG